MIRTTVAAASLIAALAACSHDSAGIKEGKSGASPVKAVTSALGQVLPGKSNKAPAQPDPGALASAALQSLKGPVIMVTFEAMKTPVVAAMRGENGAMRSYLTPDNRAFILRGGLLAGTRGYGRDLMSADTAAAGALIRAAHAGTAARTYRYLDGDGQERPLPVSCKIAPAGPIAIGPVTAMQVAEHCEGSGAVIDNSYIVTHGTILQSRQWVGPGLGYVAIQQLRN